MKKKKQATDLLTPFQTAEILDEVDALKLQNLLLRIDALMKERQTLLTSFVLKYGAPDDKSMDIDAEGRILRKKSS